MSRKREAIFVGIGVLAGLALSGPAAQASTSITATLSNQSIYVNGQQVAMTAYSIGGNNYVRLRDVGKAVDFGVTYDSATNNGPYSRGTYCSGRATLCSDAAFGSLPWRRIDSPSWDQIRPGDLVQYDTETSGHVMVVVKKTADLLYFTDSGLSNKVYWGGNVPRWWMESRSGCTLYTRYPQ